MVPPVPSLGGHRVFSRLMRITGARIGAAAERFARRTVPDPFVFAAGLTLLTWLSGIAFTDSSDGDLAVYWYRGFFDLLAFGMQMTLILVTGHALATSSPSNKASSNSGTTDASPNGANARKAATRTS